jgi:PAS domain S-box-containing protein
MHAPGETNSGFPCFILVTHLKTMTTSSDMPNPNQQAIAASEERLRALVTATSDVIYSLSADWRVMRQLDGRGFLKDTEEPLIDWRSRNIYTDDLEMVNTAIEYAINNKAIFQLEHRVWRADGTAGWTFSRAVPILNEQGEIIEWFGVASDITERKQAERALLEMRNQSEQQRRIYETITSTTPDLMYVFDLAYRFTYVNKALLAMWGKSWNNAIGKSLLENGYEPWHAEMHEREIDQVKETKQPIRGEVSFPHATLGKRIYDYIFTPVLDQNGEVEAVAGTTRDVTDRKMAEEQLAKSAGELQSINEEMAASNEELSVTNEELSEAQRQLQTMIETLGKINLRLTESETDFRRMVEQAPVAILVFRGPELVVDLANHGILEILGKDSTIIGRPLLEAMPELKGEPAVELLFDIYHKGISSDGNEVLFACRETDRQKPVISISVTVR